MTAQLISPAFPQILEGHDDANVIRVVSFINEEVQKVVGPLPEVSRVCLRPRE